MSPVAMLPARVDALAAAVEALSSASEAVEVRRQAEALKVYAVRMGAEAQAQALARLILRLDHKTGGFLGQPETREEHSSKGGRASGESRSGRTGPPGGPVEPPAPDIPKQRAAELRRLAKISQEELEAELAKPKPPTRKELLRKQREKEEAERARTAPRVRLGAEVVLKHGDMKALGLGLPPASVDVIITDPPYHREHLDLYTALGEVAAHALKEGASAFVMSGQSYLPDVIERLARSLTYHWTLAYLTPGGQAVQVWDRKVNTFWKPVLWFVKGKQRVDQGWVGDVAKSNVNDNDKRHHQWGQSLSGMLDLVSRCSCPGDLVLDPFLGGGTTAAACMRLKRRCVGFEIDPGALAKAKARLEAEAARV